jgi:hypothetical protein
MIYRVSFNPPLKVEATECFNVRECETEAASPAQAIQFVLYRIPESATIWWLDKATDKVRRYQPVDRNNLRACVKSRIGKGVRVSVVEKSV